MTGRFAPFFLLLAVAVCSASAASCGGDPVPYAPCESASDCVEADFGMGCYRLRVTRTDGSEASGGVCSRTCEQDMDCPNGGLCIALSADPARTRFCVASCERDRTCQPPHRCTPLAEEGAGLHACLP